MSSLEEMVKIMKEKVIKENSSSDLSLSLSTKPTNTVAVTDSMWTNIDNRRGISPITAAVVDEIIQTNS